MSWSNTLETGWLNLFFKNTDFTLVGDAGGLRGSAVAGSLYLSLHTADPGETGDQTTSETGYTSYVRLAVARDGTNWTVAGNQVSNALDLLFAACTGSSSTITHIGIGTSSVGAGKLCYSGALSASLAVSNGITPRAVAGAIQATAE